jgi:RHS repeat-associated protein
MDAEDMKNHTFARSRNLATVRSLAYCLALVALLMCPFEVEAQSCGGSTGGDPNKSPQCAGAGNPINVMTGNKYQLEEDMPALPGVLGLEIVRHYNSMFSGPGQPNGVIGRGWRLSYEIELVDRWGKIQVLEADGGRVIFDRNPKSPTGCSTLDPGNGTMAIGRQPDGKPDYTWTWTTGRKLHFNSAGKLDRINVPTGETLRLLYDSQNVLVRVIDPQGRSLNLVYYDPRTTNQFHGVQFIDSPVGRFAYEYGSRLPEGTGLFDQRQLLANLVRVRLPDDFAPDTKVHALSSRGTTSSKTSRLYHHEDSRSPWLMTGISVETIGTNGKPVTTRYASFGYNDLGRAILSTHAGNVDKVLLDYREAGKTVVTNSLGQRTTYRYAMIAGEYRLLEVRGAGCALCGEPNMRYDYDTAGRLIETTKLFANGERAATTRADRDKLGRITRLSKVLFEHDKPKSRQQQVRFEYRGNGFAPALIARPSVVPGKELVTRIDYNESGQPLRVSQEGWSPSAEGKPIIAKIERAIRYRYTTLHGRSLLTEIDGPLPNGKSNTPLDSDITLIEYDQRSNALPRPESPTSANRLESYAPFARHQGLITAIIMPGNRRSEIGYDYAGRIATVKASGGDTTTLRYAPHGQLLDISRNGLTYSTLYDSFNQPIEVGYSDGERYHALAHFGYDDAGRNTWTASALGFVQTKRLDTEDELLEQSTMSSTIKRTQRYEYDNLGHLRAITAADGGVRRINWNAMGVPDVLIDALGRTTHFGYDDAGRITTVADANNATTRFELDTQGRSAAVITPNGATTRFVRDDFDRIVTTVGADSGKTSRSFDAADRLIASIDANGNRADYEYDVIGRIVSQRVTDVRNGDKQTVTIWRYEGTHLAAIDHPNQAERYSYDGQDRVIAKEVILSLASGAKVRYTTRYRYDNVGLLAGISLPDGSNIDYIRNDQNQITGLERRPAATSWLRTLLQRQTIVRDVERDVIGVKRLTYGNGIEAYYQRSKKGDLERISYRDPHKNGPDTTRRAMPVARPGIHPAHVPPSDTSSLAVGFAPDTRAVIDHRYLWDVQGNLLYTSDNETAKDYAYDARDRLIAVATTHIRKTTQVAEPSPHVSFARYHYDANGNRLLFQEGFDQRDIQSGTLKTIYSSVGDREKRASSSDGKQEQAWHDATGQPESIGSRSFVWDALGKLLEVRDDQHVIARYRYNQWGERVEKIAGNDHKYFLYEGRKVIAELDETGTIRRQYVYLADRPVAIIETANSATRGIKTHASLNRLITYFDELWSAWVGKAGAVIYLHGDHLGAIEMATDLNRIPIWHAAYDAFGKIKSTSAQYQHGFEQNLRLPGQYADEETGLYYNDHRFYDPQRGRYLTPDPLGMAGGSNGYSYVSNNPLKFIDSSGLILFAFDGTNNSNPPPGVDDFSNVFKFFLAYDASQNGPKWYMNGIGRNDPNSGIETNFSDAVNANTGHARVRYMQQQLDDFMSKTQFQDGENVNIDIVGFSRGAAMARDFANRVAAGLRANKFKKSGACVQIRFVGLWDTVAQFGLNGADNTEWNLSIPEEAMNVFQAVALNEHRYAFPGEAIGRGTQKGFIGSHADIGGSYGTGDLSDVALNWIVEQAKSSGVKMRPWDRIGHREWGIVNNAVLHDKGGSDRDFCLRTNGEMWADKCEKQKQATPGGMTWRQTQTGNLISRYSQPVLDADGSSNIVGRVNMEAYAAWLKKNYGLDVRFSTP